MKLGSVERIHIATNASGPMFELDEVEAIAGVGLHGDRYATGAGFYHDEKSRNLTLIEAESIEAVAREFGIELLPGESRRNITTRGVRLNDLVGKVFRVGDVLVRGTRLCEPCTHLEAVTGKRVLDPLVHRGGLRADVLTTGTIRRAADIEAVPEKATIG